MISQILKELIDTDHVGRFAGVGGGLRVLGDYFADLKLRFYIGKID